MKISFVRPRDELRPYIESFWVLESPNGLPGAAHSIAAPNGCPKLIIPYDNSIVSVASGRVQLTRANRMNFVGNRDSATLIRTSPHRTGFIAIEFRPQGAFSIFGVPMSATSNRLWETDDVFGPWSRAVEDRINNVDRVGEGKSTAYVNFGSQIQSVLQDFLARIGIRYGRLAEPRADRTLTPGPASRSWSSPRPSVREASAPGPSGIAIRDSANGCRRQMRTGGLPQSTQAGTAQGHPACRATKECRNRRGSAIPLLPRRHGHHGILL